MNLKQIQLRLGDKYPIEKVSIQTQYIIKTKSATITLYFKGDEFQRFMVDGWAKKDIEKLLKM